MRNIPTLRFTEFSKLWSKKTLADVCSIERGRFSPRPRNDPKFYGGDVPFVQTSDVTKSNGVISSYTQTLNNEGLKVSKFFPEGTILITIAANIGFCGVLKKGMACPDSLVGLTVNSRNNTDFICTNLNRLQPKIDYLAPQAAQKNINVEFLKPFQIIIPEAEEQQKIAEFLSSVDKKISLLKEKYSLLKSYKKGVIQKLIKQEIRFKDENGNPYPDWRNVKLSELLFEHKKRNSDLEFGKEHVLSVSGELGIVNQIEHLGRSYAGVSVANYHVVHEGDIVYTKSPLKANPYGIIKSNQGKAGIVSTLYAVYSCKSTAYHKYLNYYFSIDDNVNKYLRPLVHKGAKNDMKINNQRVLIDPIFAPSIEEQKKIVSFLEAFDQKLALVKQQIELTQTFKKGLLQQMFV